MVYDFWLLFSFDCHRQLVKGQLPVSIGLQNMYNFTYQKTSLYPLLLRGFKIVESLRFILNPIIMRVST